MILAELVRSVCDKLGRSDAAFAAKVIASAKLRRDMVWQQALWRDTLAVYTRNVSAYVSPAPGGFGFVLPASPTLVYLPAHIERIIAAKADARALLPVDQVYLFNANPEAWDRAGTPTEFSRPAPSGVSRKISGLAPLLVSSNAADVGVPVSIHGESNGEEINEVVHLNGTTAVVAANTYTEIWQLSKKETAGTMTAYTGLFEILVKLGPQDTAKRYPRIQLHVQPAQAFTLAVLAKRHPTPLLNESDAIGLPALENAILAFAMADGLELLRQYAKAQEKIREGTALLESAKRNEIYQEARCVRIAPDDGVGDLGCDWE